MTNSRPCGDPPYAVIARSIHTLSLRGVRNERRSNLYFAIAPPITQRLLQQLERVLFHEHLGGRFAMTNSRACGDPPYAVIARSEERTTKQSHMAQSHRLHADCFSSLKETFIMAYSRCRFAMTNSCHCEQPPVRFIASSPIRCHCEE